ncbi:hypothetical protein [Amycolatopsis magusensis]|uniref:hypothetical protein n=1 Tax=Amycolatopsis magusensis TaxID=882444 RepID=UPI0024A92F9A|nr:hypothetical protein [Amycolatopsis magusensis]MDI5975896.1 hypothetical protein [Amycolatopsis magusensis]
MAGAEQCGQHTAEGDLFDQHGAERNADERLPEELGRIGRAGPAVVEQRQQRRYRERDPEAETDRGQARQADEGAPADQAFSR